MTCPESKAAVAPRTICCLVKKAKSGWWPMLLKKEGLSFTAVKKKPLCDSVAEAVMSIANLLLHRSGIMIWVTSRKSESRHRATIKGDHIAHIQQSKQASSRQTSAWCRCS